MNGELAKVNCKTTFVLEDSESNPFILDKDAASKESSIQLMSSLIEAMEEEYGGNQNENH